MMFMDTQQKKQGEIPTLEIQISSVRDRDDNAQINFKKWFDLHNDRVYRLIRYLFKGQGESEDYQDIVQDVFLKVWCDIDKFDPERSKHSKHIAIAFKNWINMIAVYACKDFKRKQERELKEFRHEPLEKHESVLQEETTLVDYVDTQMFADEVVEIIEKHFSKTDVTILKLKFWGGMTFREISEIVNLPESTVKTRFRRLKHKILTLLTLLTVVKEDST